MSERSRKYRHLKGKDQEATTAAILSGHGKAIGKKSGKICSLPMKPETAQRIAGALHRAAR